MRTRERVDAAIDRLFADVAREHELPSGDLAPTDDLAVEQAKRTLAVVLDRFVRNNLRREKDAD